MDYRTRRSTDVFVCTPSCVFAFGKTFFTVGILWCFLSFYNKYAVTRNIHLNRIIQEGIKQGLNGILIYH